MYNPNTKQIDVEVEIPEFGWSQRIMNRVLWGDSVFADTEPKLPNDENDFSGPESDDRDR